MKKTWVNQIKLKIEKAKNDWRSGSGTKYYKHKCYWNCDITCCGRKVKRIWILLHHYGGNSNGKMDSDSFVSCPFCDSHVPLSQRTGYVCLCPGTCMCSFLFLPPFEYYDSVNAGTSRRTFGISEMILTCPQYLNLNLNLFRYHFFPLILRCFICGWFWM